MMATLSSVFQCSFLLTIISQILHVHGQPCGRIVTAGSGTITSPNYPNWYSPSMLCSWIIRSPENTRIRLRFRVFDLEESNGCAGDSVTVYDGDNTSDTPSLGRFCGSGQPPMIDSSGRVITVVFMSDIQNEAQGFVFSHEIIDDEVGSRIVWTEIHPTTGEVRLSSLPANPRMMLTPDGRNLLPEISTQYYYKVSRGNWRAVDTDYGRQQVVWSDSTVKRILKGNIGLTARASRFVAGVSSTVNGLAVDWLTGNIYMTDATYDWILMYSSDGKKYKIVIDDYLDNPGGVAVHPIRGLLFWTDSGSKPKIERSNLAGGNRIPIVTTGIVRPQGITIDYFTNLVYWVDADPSGNRIEVCDLNGDARRLLYQANGDAGFFDLTIFDNFIYVTGSTNNTIHLLRKDTGEEGFTLNLPYRPFGIMTYAPDVQPPAASHCSSNPCSYLCVGDGPDGYMCLCGNGNLLDADGHTCREEGAISPPQIFVASRTRLCRYPSNFPDMVITENYNTSCFLEQRGHAVALAVDLEDGIVFFSDVGRKTIGMATLRQGSTVQYITGATASVEGMAVDWLTKHLYWTDNPRGEILVSKYDGSYRTTLIHENVLRPRSIAIDPVEKLMFWTEFGPPAQIERASLDGTRRGAIVVPTPEAPLSTPSGLVIDYEKKRLYYADIGTGTISSVDYNGGNKTRILTKVGAIFFQLALFKDYIMWTELGANNGIFVSNRETGQPVRAYRSSGEQMYGIKMYSDTRQMTVHNPCRYNNGGCDQLCLNSLDTQTGYVCKCTFGYHLAEDGQSCLSDVIQENFLLVADTYRRAIFQVDMSTNFEPEALQLDNLANPIGVTFDPVERKVYWSDVATGAIGRAMLDGSQQEFVATANVIQPDGIAVDAISRLLYWTDMGTHAISVAHLDGSDRKTLITGLANPRAIALHPFEGVMFWSDWRTNAVIERSFMNGDMRRVIVSGGLMWPNGLAIDFTEQRLYWCDGGFDKLESSDFLGRDRRVLINFGTNVHNFGIAISDQFVYWTDWSLRSILRANKLTGHGNVTVGSNQYTRPNALYAVTNYSLPSGTNLCSVNNGGCSSLCLPTATGRSCACADGITLAPDGVTCVSEIQVECPREFPYGGVDQSCDLQPGSNCSAECYSGYVPAAGMITCEDTGSWNIEARSICREQQCGDLPLPEHTIAGPCYPPYIEGTLCIHECEPGYIKVSGDSRRMCGHDGEWMGSPVVCGELILPSSEGTCDTNLEFTDVPENISPAQDDLIQQHCRVNNPQVDITWYKDDDRLMSGTVSGIYILPTNDLLIPAFASHHQGHYACVASFAGQECLRAEADFIFDPFRYFSAVPANASLDEGDHHVFECQAESALDVITWRKDDAPLEQTEQVIQLAGGSLLIRSLVALDAGKYTCVVSNHRRNVIKGEAHAWLTISQPATLTQINITEVCGTVLAPEAVEVSTPAPFNPRVVGGQQASRGSAPYMGRIWHKVERSFICGATLLNQKWVLTAAHCIQLYNLQANDFLLYFGDHDSLTTEDSQVVLEAAQIIQHENFNEVTFDRDIALIRLQQPFAEFTDYIRPICLPSNSLAKSLLETGTMGRVNGWGQIAEGGPYPRFLTEVDLPVVKTKKCKDATQYDFTKNMFCAGYARLERDACQGDSGGPYAVRHEDGRWYQVGIISWGEGCAREGQYGYYTKLFRFHTWMNRHIND